MFTADWSGQGLAAAVLLRVRADGSSSYEPVFRYDAEGKPSATPIELGAETDQLFLVLFGSGIRHHNGLGNFYAYVGNESAEVLYAGPQGSLAGLDQVNLRLPRRMALRGRVRVIVYNFRAFVQQTFNEVFIEIK